MRLCDCDDVSDFATNIVSGRNCFVQICSKQKDIVINSHKRTGKDIATVRRHSYMYYDASIFMNERIPKSEYYSAASRVE